MKDKHKRLKQAESAPCRDDSSNPEDICRSTDLGFFLVLLLAGDPLRNASDSAARVPLI